MKTRLIFPLFNLFIGAVIGALVGYYLLNLFGGLFWGAAAGFFLALPFEYLLGLKGTQRWLYRRRVFFLVLLEMPFTVFLVGPYMFAVLETQPNQYSLCCETPLDYGASAYEAIQVKTKDGVDLAGWYVRPVEQPGALVILLHGARGDRRGTAWHARQLIQAGYGVALYDRRALGESEGELVNDSWLDGDDLLAVVHSLAMLPEIDPARIGVVGLSGGGHVALQAAYQEPGLFSALWLDGLQAQRLEDFPEAGSAGEHFAAFINRLILFMLDQRLGGTAPKPFKQVFSELHTPQISLVWGGLEDFEARVNQNYAEIAGTNVQAWEIEDAWHLGGPHLIPGVYAQNMLEFFAFHLGK